MGSMEYQYVKIKDIPYILSMRHLPKKSQVYMLSIKGAYKKIEREHICFASSISIKKEMTCHRVTNLRTEA